ncbi:MAG: hypothetical protein GY701_10910, partial [Sulfitobacter sp.]|nr:hypothetical protein [Sulfitobacter sp.]
FYLDAKTALYWVVTQPARWETFVANRVAAIQDVTRPEEWRHVVSEENAADPYSRGVAAVDLRPDSLALAGPDWLARSPQHYPKPFVHDGVMTDDILRERKPESNLILLNLDVPDPYAAYQSLDPARYRYKDRLLVATARFLRVVDLFKGGVRRILGGGYRWGPVTVQEREAAMRFHVKRAQSVVFAKELRQITEFGGLSTDSPLLPLRPFLREGVLRVGGRLRHIDQEEHSPDRRHPALIPRGPLAEILFRTEHVAKKHTTLINVLEGVNRGYFIKGGKGLARKVLHACLDCRRFYAEVKAPLMADLPKERVRRGVFCFQVTGVDLFGPYRCFDDTGAVTHKDAWFALFTCYSSRASHLELLESGKLLHLFEALDRFTARRGCPETMWSDNAKTFVGSAKVMQRLYSLENLSTLVDRCAEKGIEWRFLPPRAPHMSCWEPVIKVAKHHLKRTVQNERLSFMQLYTMGCSVEMALNSRPLVQSDDVGLDSLTPSHLLIGRRADTIPDAYLIKLKGERIFGGITRDTEKQLRHLQTLKTRFWDRWSNEYLTTLQRRAKWAFPGREYQVGDMVLLAEGRRNRLEWELGRVEMCQRSKDGQVRTCRVRTKKGVIHRAVHYLHLLEAHEDPRYPQEQQRRPQVPETGLDSSHASGPAVAPPAGPGGAEADGEVVVIPPEQRSRRVTRSMTAAARAPREVSPE